MTTFLNVNRSRLKSSESVLIVWSRMAGLNLYEGVLERTAAQALQRNAEVFSEGNGLEPGGGPS